QWDETGQEGKRDGTGPRSHGRSPEVARRDSVNDATLSARVTAVNVLVVRLRRVAGQALPFWQYPCGAQVAIRFRLQPPETNVHPQVQAWPCRGTIRFPHPRPPLPRRAPPMRLHLPNWQVRTRNWSGPTPRPTPCRLLTSPTGPNLGLSPLTSAH